MAKPREDTARLQQRAAISDRRKLANAVARDLRLGRFPVPPTFAIHELEEHEHRCRCGFKGRAFWISKWFATGADPVERFVIVPGVGLVPAQRSRIGYWRQSPLMCAACLLARLERASRLTVS